MNILHGSSVALARTVQRANSTSPHGSSWNSSTRTTCRRTKKPSTVLAAEIRQENTGSRRIKSDDHRSRGDTRAAWHRKGQGAPVALSGVAALALAQDTSTRLHQDSRIGCMGARVIFCPIITSLRIEHGHLLCMFSTRLHPDSRTNGRSVCVSTLTRKRTIRCWRTRVIFWPDIKPRLFEHSHLIIQTGTPTCEYETATKTRCVSETSREEELRSSSRRPGPGSVGGQA